jgi:hypothetical protein
MVSRAIWVSKQLTEVQAEAGQFPGVILQMTYWYRPDEMSLRLLYFCKQSLFQS